MKHYPKGYTPQTYGEEKLADSLSEQQIQWEIDEKERIKVEDPELYRRRYCGFGM